jgi:hypothetical protein
VFLHRANKGSKTRAVGSYKRMYLGFLRAIHQTQLVSAVAEHSLHDFPKGLPPSAASAVREVFNKMGSALLVAASRADAGETDPVPPRGSLHAAVPTKPKRMPRQPDNEATEIAIDALYLMLAQDLRRRIRSPSLDLGKQFQILTRYQAVAMLYAHVDAFFGDTLRVICRTRPEVLRSGRQLTWETALSFGSMGDLAGTLAEQFIYEFGWKTLVDRIELFRSKCGVDLVIAVDELELLTLFEQRRHLIIHNGGVVTAKYIADTGDTHAKLGRQIAISRDEVRSLGHAVMMLGSNLCSAVAVKFLGAKPSDLTQVWKSAKPEQGRVLARNGADVRR